MYYEYYDCDKCGVKCRHDEKDVYQNLVYFVN